MSEKNLTPEQVAEELKGKMDAAIADAKTAKEAVDAMKADAETDKAELKSALEKLEEATKSVGNLTDELNKVKAAQLTKGAGEQEPKSFGEAFENAIDSPEFKSGVEEILSKKRERFSMEVKNVTLASVNTPVTNTMIRDGLDYLPQGETPLFDLAIKGTVPAGKNKIGYIDADFTSNSGYVSEMAAMTTKSELEANEKTVDITKYGTFMPYSAEFLQDNSTVLNWGQTEALSGLLVGLEGQLLSGIGDDTTNKSKIRGLDKYATAFDKAIATMRTESPNLIDLVQAMKLQIRKQSKGKYVPTHVFMSADDVAELVAEKDANKNPLQYRNMVVNADGTIRIAGMQVLESITLTKGTLYAITQRVWSVYSSKGFEIEVERVASTDSFVLYIRWRGQALITEKGKLGIVKATSANLADITVTP